MSSSKQIVAAPDGDDTRGTFRTITTDKIVATAMRCASAAMQASSDAIGRVVASSVTGAYAAAPMSEADRQIARLNGMRGAASGWAGPGSIAPDEESLNAAIDMIHRLRFFPIPIPMASIGSHGKAGLYWSDDKLYADVELLGGGRVGYLIQHPGGPEVDDEKDIPSAGFPAGLAQALASAYFVNER